MKINLGKAKLKRLIIDVYNEMGEGEKGAITTWAWLYLVAISLSP